MKGLGRLCQRQELDLEKALAISDAQVEAPHGAEALRVRKPCTKDVTLFRRNVWKAKQVVHPTSRRVAEDRDCVILANHISVAVCGRWAHVKRFNVTAHQ